MIPVLPLQQIVIPVQMLLEKVLQLVLVLMDILKMEMPLVINVIIPVLHVLMG